MYTNNHLKKKQQKNTLSFCICLLLLLFQKVNYFFQEVNEDWGSNPGSVIYQVCDVQRFNLPEPSPSLPHWPSSTKVLALAFGLRKGFCLSLMGSNEVLHIVFSTLSGRCSIKWYLKEKDSKRVCLLHSLLFVAMEDSSISQLLQCFTQPEI